MHHRTYFERTRNMLATNKKQSNQSNVIRNMSICVSFWHALLGSLNYTYDSLRTGCDTRTRFLKDSNISSTEVGMAGVEAGMWGPLGRAGGVAHATVCFTVGVKRTHAYFASQDMYVYTWKIATSTKPLLVIPRTCLCRMYFTIRRSSCSRNLHAAEYDL